MALAVWRESMSLSYPPLDDEHKAFMMVINRAFIASQKDDFETIEAIFEKCYDYARNHFSHEERIMERINFPDSTEHMKAHQVFIQNVAEMRQNYDVAVDEDMRRKISIKLANFLNIWFLGHILSRDKILKPYLIRIRNLPPKMSY